jgi:hypothetical protein
MDYSVRIFRNAEEIETLRPFWTQWQVHPNSDLDHFLLICQNRSSAVSPYIIVVYRGERPVAMLVSRLEDGEVAPAIGYFRPFRLPVKRLAVVYHGVLGELNEEIGGVLLQGLKGASKLHGADVVELFHLPKKSPLLRAALSKIPWIWRDGSPAWSIHWELTLPKRPASLLQAISSKHRAWLRRKMRELEKAYPDSVNYRTYSPGESIPQLCEKLEEVARLTYQRSLSAGFIDDPEHRARLELFSRSGGLRAWILSVDGSPKAYALGVAYGDTFHFWMTGYDQAFRKFEAGTLIFLHRVDALIEEGVVKFDFGLGDAAYKQRFGDRSWEEGSLRLYSRSLKGLVARTSVGMVESAATVGRKIAGRLGVVTKLKTAWRRWIAPVDKDRVASES